MLLPGWYLPTDSCLRARADGNLMTVLIDTANHPHRPCMVDDFVLTPIDLWRILPSTLINLMGGGHCVTGPTRSERFQP